MDEDALAFREPPAQVMNAGATARSAMPAIAVKAATRSPGDTPAPSGADCTIPATSAPGTNGRSGLYW